MSQQFPPPPEPVPGAGPRPSRARVVLVWTVLLAVVVGMIVVGGLLYARNTGSDAGVTTPSAVPTYAIGKPGRLLGAATVTSGVPFGTRAWKITYTTTRDDGVPATATALVFLKKKLPPGARPVIAWAHGTTGVATGCAPSTIGARYAATAIPAFSKIINGGAVVVATDYTGLGSPGPHPYLIGQGEGRAVLDSVRAVHQLQGLDLADRTVVWGHSQGGHAALWAGILAPTYAPDAHVVGVAGIAPATNLPALVDNLRRYQAGAVFGAYVLAAYTAGYPGLDPTPYVRPSAYPVLKEMATRCLSDALTLARLTQTLPAYGGYFAQDPNSGALGKRLAQNVPDGVIPAPVFIGQGTLDPLVLPTMQAGYVAQRCAQAGNGPLDYRTYPGRDHGSVIHPSSAMIPDLLTWTEDRFAQKAAPTTC